MRFLNITLQYHFDDEFSFNDIANLENVKNSIILRIKQDHNDPVLKCDNQIVLVDHAQRHLDHDIFVYALDLDDTQISDIQEMATYEILLLNRSDYEITFDHTDEI